MVVKVALFRMEGLFFMFVTILAPAIGGIVVAVRMLIDYGTCEVLPGE
jgi:hypothetical protein